MSIESSTIEVIEKHQKVKELNLIVVAILGQPLNVGQPTAHNSVFPLTGRVIQRSGFEEESGFTMVIQGADS